MTLIATAISNLGIVMASDSNSTDAATGELIGEVPKVWRADSIDAVFAAAGSGSIGGKALKDWVPAAVRPFESMLSPTLRDFAEYLRDKLQGEANIGERHAGILFHIAGYVGEGDKAHPEFWFVRNVTMDLNTGNYVPHDRFDASEDFWYRDYLNPEVQAALEAGSEQRYFNGVLHGRVAYLLFMQQLAAFLRAAWQQPGWAFRAPANVQELGKFIDVEIRAIGAMFNSSDYAGPYIGGPVQVETISPPANAVRLGHGAPTSRRGPA